MKIVFFFFSSFKNQLLPRFVLVSRQWVVATLDDAKVE